MSRLGVAANNVHDVSQVGDSYEWTRPCSVKTAICTGEKTSGLFTVHSDAGPKQINVCKECFDYQVETKKWVRVTQTP